MGVLSTVDYLALALGSGTENETCTGQRTMEEKCFVFFLSVCVYLASVRIQTQIANGLNMHVSLVANHCVYSHKRLHKFSNFKMKGMS